MIKFDKVTLNNGLRIILNKDHSTPFVALNILYDVGSKDENPEKTGFAHLFEHLMFGGSVNIADFDDAIQKVGGDSNAFTNTDITNYYCTLPKENIETAFWLESDRMLELDFSQKVLDIQKNVVCEEFKQRYLNKPYGDAYMLLRPLSYKVHPYRWQTIGKDISHIRDANLNDVKNFFFKHYAPNNAILSVSGNFENDKIIELSEKWFGTIENRNIAIRNLPEEPVQKEARSLLVERDVPHDSIYKAFHMCARAHNDFHTIDLISDILSNGKSSRLYNELVKEKRLFSEISAFVSAEIEQGLFIISGNLIQGVTFEEADRAINEEIQKLKEGFVFEYELMKVKNKVESTIKFSETSITNKSMNLAKYELLGNADFVNTEIDKYQNVDNSEIQKMSRIIFDNSNCSTLYYKSVKK